MIEQRELTQADLMRLAIEHGDTTRQLIERAREATRRDAMTWAVERNMPEAEALREVELVVEVFEAAVRGHLRQ